MLNKQNSMPAASNKRKRDNVTPETVTPHKRQKTRKANTPPNIAIQSDEAPNVFLGSDEDPMQHLVVHDNEVPVDPKVIAHEKFVLPLITGHFCQGVKWMG
jgi:hypothetical protein